MLADAPDPRYLPLDEGALPQQPNEASGRHAQDCHLLAALDCHLLAALHRHSLCISFDYGTTSRLIELSLVGRLRRSGDPLNNDIIWQWNVDAHCSFDLVKKYSTVI